MKFTLQQVEDWRAYEGVRRSWAYNMFDPRARQLTALPGERYRFVMENYDELRELVESEKVRPPR